MLCCDDTVRENGSTEKANKRTSIALEMIEKIGASIDTVNTSVSVAAEEKTTQIGRNDAGEGLCLPFGRGLYSPAVFELYRETLLAVAATVARKSLCAL